MPEIRLRSFLRREDGAAFVELAFAAPILLMLVWGIIDFGRVFYTANSLTNAVREGARYAAVTDDPTTDAAAIKQHVKDTFYAFGGPAIDTSKVTITDNSAVAGKSSITVTVTNYPLPIITPMAALIGDTLGITREATFRWEKASE